MVAFIDKYDLDGIEVDWETAVTFRFEGSKQRLDRSDRLEKQLCYLWKNIRKCRPSVQAASSSPKRKFPLRQQRVGGSEPPELLRVCGMTCEELLQYLESGNDESQECSTASYVFSAC